MFLLPLFNARVAKAILACSRRSQRFILPPCHEAYARAARALSASTNAE
jgi:hypothetical protein